MMFVVRFKYHHWDKVIIFLTFIDDSTLYVYMYILKNKSQMFEKFVEWKALIRLYKLYVQNVSG